MSKIYFVNNRYLEKANLHQCSSGGALDGSSSVCKFNDKALHKFFVLFFATKINTFSVCLFAGVL